MYQFNYNLSVNELVMYLKQHTYKTKFLDTDYGITLKQCGLTVKLRQKTIMPHPLQRIFVGKIYTHTEGAKIVGDFRYPLIMSIMFLVLTAVLVVYNIDALLNVDNIINAIIICVMFLIMYLVIAIIFLTGKICYKTEENEVITLLEKICK